MTTKAVQKILANYESDNPGVKANLYRILNQGKLGGTGKLIILPVDQGFEHGPARSFSVNAPAYDPHYHYQMAIDAGLSAYAAPLGSLEAGADKFAARSPRSSRSTARTAGRRKPTRRSPARFRMRCAWAARRSASPSIRAATIAST
jgi:DhnA family fructose-bisphosphate aldolase class Ia